jgi:perosamine synthetase
MIPRGALSISYRQLLNALIFHFSWTKPADPPLPVKYGKSIFCLSVRTGLHLSLKALDFEKGSEILITNINIPDMFAIIDAHELKSVPVTLNKHTLNINLVELQAKLTSRSKAILVTHLFGAIANMDEISVFAQKNGLIVIEDCAQAFDGNYCGHENTTVSLFSFGLIKTNTCLTGAMLCFNNGHIFGQVNALNQQLPQQPTRKFTQKIAKAFCIKLITTRWVYTILYGVIRLLNKDFDDFLATFTKGFPGTNVMEKILFRPCPANLKLLSNRTSVMDFQSIAQRKKIAQQILQQLPIELQIGNQNLHHSYWVFPVCNSATLMEKLRKNGIDATARASSLVSLPTHFPASALTALKLTELIYLPIHDQVADRIKSLL